MRALRVVQRVGDTEGGATFRTIGSPARAPCVHRNGGILLVHRARRELGPGAPVRRRPGCALCTAARCARGALAGRAGSRDRDVDTGARARGARERTAATGRHTTPVGDRSPRRSRHPAHDASIGSGADIRFSRRRLVRSAAQVTGASSTRNSFPDSRQRRSRRRADGEQVRAERVRADDSEAEARPSGSKTV